MDYEFKPLGMGVIQIEHVAHEDERGWFMEDWNKKTFKNNGIDTDFMQINISRSKNGVLRGLHFQRPPFSQAKLVKCLKGEVFDVAVDVRKNSPTFGKYVGVVLSETNLRSIFIPRGFAHGFLVTSQEDAIVAYLVDNEYNKESEGGLRWNDPTVGIKWPANPKIVKERDANLPLLKDVNYD
jgi:dTDP-4-dehydrorhamnose 3,5-epimerase